ncbi:MAG: hypothetical protein ACRD3O_07235 [Terriglobia bacterium]
MPERTIWVVRLEFFTPQGQPYLLYARSLLVRSTPHSEAIPLAHNDPTGRWLVRARDVMTGEMVELRFIVRN